MFSCQYNHIHYIHWHDIHSKMVSIINIYTLPPPYTYSLIYPTMHKWNHISAHFIDSFQRFFSKISLRLIVYEIYNSKIPTGYSNDVHFLSMSKLLYFIISWTTCRLKSVLCLLCLTVSCLSTLPQSCTHPPKITGI